MPLTHAINTGPLIS